ncbi:MAG: CoA transferase [Chloroflexi bacterium]|nr:CoA transferase [Chloroflexota bacterium]
MSGTRLPLEGITIADFSWVLAGPRATEYLGAMGARIIKIEGPYRPDQFRSSPIEIPGADSEKYSATFWSLNYSKLGCTIDFTQPKGRELALKLAAVCDVVIENYAYGVMEKARLTYEDFRQVNPEIIMVAGSALGKTGPSKAHVTYGALLHAFSGLNSVTGYEGEPSGTLGGTFTDPLTGATLALAVLAAVWRRRRTGRGQFVDAAMSETTINQFPEAFLDYTVNGRVGGPQGNSEASGAPHGCYPCRGENRWIAIAVRNQPQWEALCGVLGDPEWTRDPRFTDQYQRWCHRAALGALVAGWTQQQDAIDLMHRLQRAGVPAGATYHSGDVLADAHHRARGFLVPLEQEIVGRKPVLRLPWLLDPGPNGNYFPAPLLGQHNDFVFREILGLSAPELEELRAGKVIL